MRKHIHREQDQYHMEAEVGFQSTFKILGDHHTSIWPITCHMCLSVGCGQVLRFCEDGKRVCRSAAETGQKCLRWDAKVLP